jgi:hypothetical protein
VVDIDSGDILTQGKSAGHVLTSELKVAIGRNANRHEMYESPGPNCEQAYQIAD